MAHRLRAFQPAEHFLDAVQVMVRPINPIPLCLVIGGLFIFPPDGDRVIAYLLIKFRTLPAARDQLRREVEIVCQLLFEQHMELLPHLGAHIVIPTRGKFDEPYNVRLVLRLQVCIVTRIKTHDTVRHIVIDRRIRHILQHQPIQLKRELMAVAPANSGAIARIAAATAALKTVRACLRHKCQRIFHAPPLDEIRADRKRVGLLARAGEIEVRVRLRLQTGEIGNAAHDRPGIRGLAGRPVHDLKFLPVCVRDRRMHGRSVVIADLVDKDLRIFDLRRRASQRQILRLFGALRRDHAGIDRDVVKQRHRVVHAQTDLTARRARIIFKLFDAIDIADHLFARYCHAQPVRLSVLYLCLMFRRRSDRAVLVRPPQKLRTCFYAMIQPEMVNCVPSVCWNVTPALYPLPFSPFTRATSATMVYSVGRSLVIGSAARSPPPSPPLARSVPRLSPPPLPPPASQTAAGRARAAGRAISVFFSFRFLLDLYFQLYFMGHPSPQHNRDTLVCAANKTVHAHRKNV